MILKEYVSFLEYGIGINLYTCHDAFIHEENPDISISVFGAESLPSGLANANVKGFCKEGFEGRISFLLDNGR